MSATIIIKAIDSITEYIPVSHVLAQPQLEYVPADDDTGFLSNSSRN